MNTKLPKTPLDVTLMSHDSNVGCAQKQQAIIDDDGNLRLKPGGSFTGAFMS